MKNERLNRLDFPRIDRGEHHVRRPFALTAPMKAAVFISILGGLALSTPARAHHSYAMFDRTKDVVLVGTVKDWQWTNPHTWMVLVAPGPHGKPIEWNLEGQSTQVLRLLGWNRDMVKAGDKVTVHMNPLKSGAIGGQLAGVTGADGHVYGQPHIPK